MSLDEVVPGTCNCGAITLQIAKESFPSSSLICHCRNCKASSGSLFSLNLIVPANAVVINGNPKAYTEKECDSGHHMDRCFCPTCGSAVYSAVSEDRKNLFIKGGLFARAGCRLPPPVSEVWLRRAEKWETRFGDCSLLE